MEFLEKLGSIAVALIIICVIVIIYKVAITEYEINNFIECYEHTENMDWCIAKFLRF